MASVGGRAAMSVNQSAGMATAVARGQSGVQGRGVGATGGTQLEAEWRGVRVVGLTWAGTRVRCVGFDAGVSGLLSPGRWRSPR